VVLDLKTIQLKNRSGKTFNNEFFHSFFYLNKIQIETKPISSTGIFLQYKSIKIEIIFILQNGYIFSKKRRLKGEFKKKNLSLS